MIFFALLAEQAWPVLPLVFVVPVVARRWVRPAETAGKAMGTEHWGRRCAHGAWIERGLEGLCRSTGCCGAGPTPLRSARR